jgi:hypothetical protein
VCNIDPVFKHPLIQFFVEKKPDFFMTMTQAIDRGLLSFVTDKTASRAFHCKYGTSI